MRDMLPTPGSEPGALVEALVGVQMGYPARVYEWEMRAWRLLSSPTLSPWRGLFPQPQPTSSAAGLRERMTERIQQLQTVLSRCLGTAHK